MTNFLLKKAGLAFDEGKTRLALKKSTLALLIVIETKTKSAKAKRRKAAAGLQSGMNHQASMDVEQLIRQDCEIQAYDAIKVQCNQLADRLRVLGSEKECPPGTKQAVCTLIWAAGKAEVPEELQVVKVQLTKKYGKDFATKALNNDDGCINKLVAEKLLFQADPAPKLVEEYLEAIGKESDAAIVQKPPPPLPRILSSAALAGSVASATSASAVLASALTASAPKAATAPAQPVDITTEAPEESPTKNTSKAITKGSMESPPGKTPSKTPKESSTKHPKETPEEETPKRTRSRESPEDETPKTAPTTSPSSSTTSPIVAKSLPPQFMKSVTDATAGHGTPAPGSEPSANPDAFKALPVSIRRAANAAAGSVRPIIPA